MAWLAWEWEWARSSFYRRRGLAGQFLRVLQRHNRFPRLVSLRQAGSLLAATRIAYLRRALIAYVEMLGVSFAGSTSRNSVGHVQQQVLLVRPHFRKQLA